MPLRPGPALPHPGTHDDDIRHTLLTEIYEYFTDHWHVTDDQAGARLSITWRGPPGPRRPARRPLRSSEVLTRIEEAFAERGVARGRVLPIRWNRDTDLTISAVQALDPYLKDGRPFTYSQGFIPQPVVRFTGKRDDAGRLQPGFLTSFVNVSCVVPIQGVGEHVWLIDTWIGALSRLGLHARHLRIHGTLDIWARGNVRGITLHFTYAGTTIGDAVLLWNTERPRHMASDIGSGLERLRWVQTGRSWPEAAFGDHVGDWPLELLDAVRTATLLVEGGIRPGARAPSSALNRVLDQIPRQIATAGLGRLVRNAYVYWGEVARLRIPWPVTSQIIEEAVVDHAAHKK